MSPMPLARPSPWNIAGCEITGTMVRVMMFHSGLISKGITGWMFRMFCVPLNGPVLRLALYWNGTLIRLPTGFCASLASSSALISADAGMATDNATIEAAHVTQACVLNDQIMFSTPQSASVSGEQVGKQHHNRRREPTAAIRLEAYPLCRHEQASIQRIVLEELLSGRGDLSGNAGVGDLENKDPGGY